ncbi:DsbA family oxidoreductase [Roseomonas elaeocarpi]|uniref:DsbA family oxidoreductase n=1 Tax=Roseomonas elaeocarpi TaxID=907779 RepID=A0ABV6JXT1_9PROT
MNILVPPRARLPVDVVFDLVCPWCFLGVRRLQRALRMRPDFLVEISWRPFLLNPEVGSTTRGEHLGRRFGGEERTRRLHATLTELGRVEGIEFRLDLLRRVPSSLDAHRLVRLAAREGRADAAVDLLFESYFSRGLDISSDETLVALGTSLGLDPLVTRRFLASGAEVEAIHAENLRAHRLGINGVPCFVVAERHAIAGAQEPEVLERLLDVALAESAAAY